MRRLEKSKHDYQKEKSRIRIRRACWQEAKEAAHIVVKVKEDKFAGDVLTTGLPGARKTAPALNIVRALGAELCGSFRL